MANVKRVESIITVHSATKHVPRHVVVADVNEKLVNAKSAKKDSGEVIVLKAV